MRAVDDNRTGLGEWALVEVHLLDDTTATARRHWFDGRCGPSD